MQGLGQVLHFFGEQRRAVELDHLQGTMNLVNALQALREGLIAGLVGVGVQRRTGLLQGVGDLALDPFEGDVVVPVNHNDSRLNG